MFKKIITCAILGTLALPVLSQPISIYACSMQMLRPWPGGYQTGETYGGGAGTYTSENEAIEYWGNQFVSYGFPREIFKVVCANEGPPKPPSNLTGCNQFSTCGY